MSEGDVIDKDGAGNIVDGDVQEDNQGEAERKMLNQPILLS